MGDGFCDFSKLQIEMDIWFKIFFCVGDWGWCEIIILKLSSNHVILLFYSNVN
jgi:hypothetical protein